MRTTDLHTLELTIHHADIVEATEDGVLIYENGITIRLSDSVADKIVREQTSKSGREVLEGNARMGMVA